MRHPPLRIPSPLSLVLVLVLLLLTHPTPTTAAKNKKQSPTTTTSSTTTPIQLLAPTDAARSSVKVMEEGLRVIEQLKGPIAVVAVVGPYHSGKSFLLNNLVRNLQEYTRTQTQTQTQMEESDAFTPIFEVGRSVDPSTAGIWAHHQRVRLPKKNKKGESGVVLEEEEGEEGEGKGNEVDLLLFDTEGFAVANVTETYDSKIFAVSVCMYVCMFVCVCVCVCVCACVCAYIDT
jgi:hypothetical protein